MIYSFLMMLGSLAAATVSVVCWYKIRKERIRLEALRQELLDKPEDYIVYEMDYAALETRLADEIRSRGSNAN